MLGYFDPKVPPRNVLKKMFPTKTFEPACLYPVSLTTYNHWLTEQIARCVNRALISPPTVRSAQTHPHGKPRSVEGRVADKNCRIHTSGRAKLRKRHSALDLLLADQEQETFVLAIYILAVKTSLSPRPCALQTWLRELALLTTELSSPLVSGSPKMANCLYSDWDFSQSPYIMRYQEMRCSRRWYPSNPI